MHMARILIVDDEQMIREVVREYALINGYEVAEASDGLEALELVEKEDFDCVILDIMMPKLDGFSALSWAWTIMSSSLSRQRS